MPRKWQIFKIVSIIQFLITLLISFGACYALVIMLKGEAHENGDVEGIVVGILGFVAVLFYYFYCIQMSVKYYPDSEMPTFYNSLFGVVYVVTAITAVLLSIGFVVLLIGSFDKSKSQSNTFEKIMFILLFLYCIGNIYSLFYSIKLRKFIKRNFIEKQNNSIENLGTNVHNSL